ncbi:MAG: AEC family transporter [Rhodospirillaceae bacterium]|nr:AEC family transporter [Rhodospirillales bacterium]
MSTIAGALAPIFMLIMLGWGFRARGFLNDAFWVPAERLTYYVLFPALLITNLAEAKLDGLPVAAILGAQGSATLLLAALSALIATHAHRRPFRLDGAGASSLFQGIVRPNTYVGFAAAAGLFGAEGVTLTALCVALVVPLVNLLSVIGLIHFIGPKQGARRGWRGMVMPIVTNPIIISCMIGIALNGSGVGLPPIIGPFCKILGQGSLALGLLAVGAGLEVRAIRETGPTVTLAILGRLVLSPLVVAGLAWMLGVRGLPFAVCVVYGGLPVAPNAYVLARQLGGDARLMAGIITLSTVAAAFSLAILAVLVS